MIKSHRLRVIFLCALFLALLTGCHPKSHLPWFNDRVNYTFIVHEDGSCTGEIFGRKIDKKHKATFSDYRNKNAVRDIECRSSNPFYKTGTTTIRLRMSSFDDDDPLPIDRSLDSASRITKVKRSGDGRAFVSITAGGDGSLDGIFCLIRIEGRVWTLVANTGRDRKQHILSGSGVRSCSL